MKWEKVGNTLIVAVKLGVSNEYYKEINIIDCEQRIILYTFTAGWYKIDSGFICIKVVKNRGKAFGKSDTHTIKTINV